MTPDGTTAYLTCVNDSVLVIDTASNTIIATIMLTAGSDPFGIAISPNGSLVYVVNGGAASGVTIIEKASNTMLGTIPLLPGSGSFEIALNPSGTLGYVTNLITQSVTVLNLTTNTIVTEISVAGAAPVDIVVSIDGTRVYVAMNAGQIEVIDATTNTLLIPIALPAGSFPISLAVAPDGHRLFVTTIGVSSLLALNSDTTSLVERILFPGAELTNIAISADASTFIFIDAMNSIVLLYSAANYSLIAKLPVGNQSTDVALTPILLF
nr:YncE family protein [Paenibacillus sp. CF384]